MCFLLLNNEKPTQLLADVVLDDPGEDWVLGEIVEAPVGGAVEVDEVVKVGDEAVLPLEGHVVLPDVLEVEKRLRDKTIKKKKSRLKIYLSPFRKRLFFPVDVLATC